MTKYLLWVLCALAFIFCAPAGAMILGFEGHVDGSGSPDDGAQVAMQTGFSFNFDAAGWGIYSDSFDGGGGPYVHDGTERLLLAGASQTDAARPGSVVMARENGRSFSLYALDAATVFPNTSGLLLLEATLAGGGSVSATLALADRFRGYALSGFIGIQRLILREAIASDFGNTPGLQVDNLRVDQPKAQPVPEPASVALLTLALLALIVRFCGRGARNCLAEGR